MQLSAAKKDKCIVEDAEDFTHEVFCMDYFAVCRCIEESGNA